MLTLPPWNLNGRGLYKGKWTREEEEYLVYLCKDFKDGALDIKEGSSLRAFLAEMLGCNPKRVSKKMECTNYYGRGVFMDQKASIDPKELEERREKLEGLRKKFLESREELLQQEAAKLALKAPSMMPAMPLGIPRLPKFSAALNRHSTASTIPAGLVVPQAMPPRENTAFEALAMIMLMNMNQSNSPSWPHSPTTASNSQSASSPLGLEQPLYSSPGDNGTGSATNLSSLLSAALLQTVTPASVSPVEGGQPAPAQVTPTSVSERDT